MNSSCFKILFQLGFCVFFISLNFKVKAQTFFNSESGVLFTSINTIKNGRNGTVFSLKKDLHTPPTLFLRIRTGVLLRNKHKISILYAPLKFVVNGTVDKNILFDGETFNANVPLTAIYKFNSYRLTYTNRLVIHEDFKTGFGVSLKIRDAGVSLKNEENFKENFSVGFAPLLNIVFDWDISKKVGLDFFAEGIAAPKGRAIDLFLSGRYLFTKSLHGNIGYRLLEGGANGYNRSNFIQLHFIVFRLTILLG